MTAVRPLRTALLPLLTTVLGAASTQAAEDQGPRLCNFLGREYGVGEVLFLNDKIIQCSAMFSDTVDSLFYWVRLTEEEARVRLEKEAEEAAEAELVANQVLKDRATKLPIIRAAL